MDSLGVDSMAWARCLEGSASSLARNEASALGLAATATRSAVLPSGPVLVPHGTAAQVSRCAWLDNDAYWLVTCCGATCAMDGLQKRSLDLDERIDAEQVCLS